MAARQEVIHARKLEQALRSNERFPINLEWMVDVFKYKHISSLTTHLKRHFKMNVHYKRFAQEQNKRVWTYFISVECFIGICEYVRHAARKKIANVWLRKVGIKGSSRRTAREEENVFSEEEVDDDEEEEDVEDEVEGEDEEYLAREGEDEEVYEYFESPQKRRRVEDDEEYRCEEEEEDREEYQYFQEMEEEEACVEYDTDESSVDYESSSSRADSPSFIHNGTVMIPCDFASNKMAHTHFRIIPSSSSESLNSSSELSSPASSPAPSPASSAPTSPNACERVIQFPTITPPQPVRMQTPPTVKPHVPESELLPPNAVEMCKEQVDWSYLHLRPNPHPMGGAYDFPAKYFASLMFGPQYSSQPQVQPMYNYMFAHGSFVSNYHGVHMPNMLMDPSGYAMGNLHCDLPNMDERQFDTNMFLSFPEEHHFQFSLNL